MKKGTLKADRIIVKYEGRYTILWVGTEHKGDGIVKKIICQEDGFWADVYWEIGSKTRFFKVEFADIRPR